MQHAHVFKATCTRNMCCCTQHVHMFKATCARKMGMHEHVNVCTRNMFAHAARSIGTCTCTTCVVARNMCTCTTFVVARNVRVKCTRTCIDLAIDQHVQQHVLLHATCARAHVHVCTLWACQSQQHRTCEARTCDVSTCAEHFILPSVSIRSRRS
jgi:hypothetical protein